MSTKKDFDADVAQLIQLVTHSVYSNKDVFLRELISNANDAIQKAKMKAAQDTKYLSDETDLEIIVRVDEDKNVISVEDTGVGMSRDEIVDNLGKIASSGTKKFLETVEKAKKKADKGEKGSAGDLIGQFGIGFYSAFMVADRVEVESKAQGEDAVKWSSKGKGTYELDDSDRENRGTVVRLYLSEDAKEYAHPQRLRELITRHSNYVPVPIKMPKVDDDGNQTDELEKVNQMKSIWTRQKSEVKDEEYKEFYQMLTFDRDEPLDTIHIHIEGMVNFKALLYIPKKAPMFGHIDAEQDYGPSLYVQNVVIQERCKDLLPVWLRFVRGVVETPDLSLNVSREMIQSSNLLDKIQKTLVKEILKSLTWLNKNEQEAYKEFFSNYSRYIKEGVHYDQNNKEKIAETLLYHSWAKDKLITLDKYIEDLDGEDPVYYLIGNSMTQLQASPYLEQFSKDDNDVLLMDDAIDEWVMKALQEYKDHELQSVMQADVDKDEDNKKELEKKEKKHKDFLSFVKETVGKDALEEVKLSKRLKDSPAILVAKDGQTSAQMERIMEAMGQNAQKGKRILELNVDHPLVKKMIKLHKGADGSSKKSSEASKLAMFAYEQAVLLEGGMVENMNEFLSRVSELLSEE